MKHGRCFAAMAGLLVAGVVAGCQSSSQTVTHTYEYSHQGQAPVNQPEVVHEPPASEYRMSSPGEMVSPGEMAGPGRMVAEPRRNP